MVFYNDNINIIIIVINNFSSNRENNLVRMSHMSVCQSDSQLSVCKQYVKFAVDT